MVVFHIGYGAAYERALKRVLGAFYKMGNNSIGVCKRELERFVEHNHVSRAKIRCETVCHSFVIGANYKFIAFKINFQLVVFVLDLLADSPWSVDYAVVRCERRTGCFCVNADFALVCIHSDDAFVHQCFAVGL